MKRRLSTVWALGAALALSTFTLTSRAQEARAQTSASPPAGDYSYVFTDDPMQAGAFTPYDARIVVSTRVNRATLIRPRTAFVIEMLKSVDRL